MKEQMGRWFSISNTCSEFILSCLSIGYSFQVNRCIVQFTGFPLFFFSPSLILPPKAKPAKQNILLKPQQVYMHIEINNKLSYTNI